MGIDAFRHVGCPDVEFTDEFGMGDETGHNFETLYLGHKYEQISMGF
jgi:hypothetical protein